MFTIISSIIVVTVVLFAVGALLRASHGGEGIPLQRIAVTVALTIGALVLAAVLVWVLYLSKIHIG